MRSIFKSAAALLFCIAVLMTSLVSAANPGDVKDLPEASRYSYNPLVWALEEKLVDPAEGNVYPGQALLRAELADIMVRYLGKNATGVELAPLYDDVDKAAWYYTSLGKAYNMGIILGYARMMRPLDKITREEAFTILARTLKLNDEEKTIAEMKAFDDVDAVSDWATKKVAALVKAKYVLGAPSMTNAELKSVNPKDFISREEFITIIWRTRNTPFFPEHEYQPAPVGGGTSSYRLEVVTGTGSAAPVAKILKEGLSTPEGNINLVLDSSISDTIPLSNLVLTVNYGQSGGKRKTYFGMEIKDGQSYTFKQLFNELVLIAESKSKYVDAETELANINKTNATMGDLRKLYVLVNRVYESTIDTMGPLWETYGITMHSDTSATILYDIYDAAGNRTKIGAKISLDVDDPPQ